jgi:hypothetical protein
MVFGAAGCVGHDSFEDFEQGFDFDFEAGFFADFAAHGVFEAFAGFEDSAWQGPVAFQGFAASFHEEDFVPFKDERAYSWHGAWRVAA